MDDLIAFLRARLDEDEQVARDATAGPWTTSVGGTSSASVHGRRYPVAQAIDEGPCLPEDAHHIARHDPARVLADVAAKRQIVQRAEDAEKDSLSVEFETDDQVSTRVVLEQVLRLLAVPYAAHPDYQEGWKP